MFSFQIRIFAIYNFYLQMEKLLFLFFLVFSFTAVSQFEPDNGVKESSPAFYALTKATVKVAPGKTLHNATVLIKDNKIISVGPIVIIPKEAVVIDCSKKVILPAFIDLNSDNGIAKAKPKTNNSRYPQINSLKNGPYYWNECIHPEINASELYHSDEKHLKELASRGFGFFMTHQRDGVARGSAALISMSRKRTDLSNNINASCYSFSKGSSRQTYPSSQMGSIALLRQSFYDADYYARNKEAENLTLDALNQQRLGSLFFETQDKFEILRADKIAREFGFQFNFFGSGNEYEIVHLLKDKGYNIILPINYPAAYDVKDPYVSRQIPLSELKHWEMAPQNAAILNRNGINICITSHGTKNSKEFWSNLRKTISFGLDEEDALSALTVNPSKLIGIDSILGTLEKGKLASFMIYDKNPLEEDATLLEAWNQGERTVLNTLPNHDIRGKYNLNVEGNKWKLEISGEEAKPKGKLTYSYKDINGLEKDSTINVYVELEENDITLQFVIDNGSIAGNISLKGKVSSKFGVFEGEGLFPDGTWVKWTGVKHGKVNVKDKKKEDVPADTLNRTWLPNMAYGFESLPDSSAIVIKNARIWTNEAEGIIDNGTVVIENGKIVYVGEGSGRTPAGARVIDAKGKSVTSGIIDEHSHIAISRGVNEGGQSVSAEVSIGDVVNPDDINIYRQLSGGVTASQLLHGSANPIGGQSALVKLKWGHSPDEMLIDHAPGFIKFALGENVKQTNWGDHNVIRFPQTRMGVEQVYYDAFIRAKKYEQSWKKYNADTTLSKPRVDLELEVLGEILRSERFVTCHSYIQSEINMLMHVADSMGFKINTFTHILEGYKLADKMAEHGAGGSTFSDWWAYKYEVNDAIPYNAKLMHDQGVVVAVNSDDAEMGRRLNQEAAKAVKYGGMSEEDAWKMVTLNPAKLLHLDNRMGSIKVGKDADVVIWTDNPLSINAKVRYTIVDGEILFDEEHDREMRKTNQAEKARIITKMLSENKKGAPSRKFFQKKNGSYHCDTMGEEVSTEENHH